MPEGPGTRKDDAPGGERPLTSLARGIRLDLLIAVCALLVSSLATAASWWQTRVIQQQLSAQVWPYVDVGATYGDGKVSFSIDNDGLGPAILRSAAISVDGKERTGFIDVMHAILGPDIVKRKPKREAMGFDMSSATPGTVVRAGEKLTVFEFTSKTFAPPLGRSLGRIATRICYCAILPGTCWLKESNSPRDPQQLASCPAVEHNALSTSFDAVMNRKF